MRLSGPLLLALLFPFLLPSVATAVDADLLEAALAATFRLTGPNSSGTSFLVSLPESENDTPTLALVTAAHVLEGIAGPEAILILRSKVDDANFARKEHKLTIRAGGKPLWRKHSELDIAALKVTLPEGVAAKSFAFDQLADEKALRARKVHVGQDAWIPCYPARLEANPAGWPVLRKGSISSFPLLPTRTVRTILVDYSNFGGDSGAPVVVCQGKTSLIVGLVLGMHRQTDRAVLPFEERTMHTPLGVAIVVQAEHIRQTLRLLDR